MFSGLVFGSAAVLGMMMPLELPSGVIFDPRSAVLANAGLFGGPLAAVVASVMAGAYRTGLGPPGDMIGLAVIATSAGLGLAYRRLHQRGRVPLNVGMLLVFGLIVHGVAAALFLLLPGDIAWEVTRTVTPVFVPVLTAATVLLGLMLRDVTTHAALERAVHRSETHLKSLFETAETGIWTQDLNPLSDRLDRLRRSGVTDIRAHLAEDPAALRRLAQAIRIVDANPAVLRLFGVETAPAVTHTLLIHFDDGPAPAFVAFVEALWSGASVFRSQAVFRDRAGRRFDAIMTVPLPRDRETRACVPVTLLDVTDRVRTERLVREREELYRSVIVTAHDGFWIVNTSGCLLEVNDAYLRMTGYRREDLMGCTPDKVDVLETPAQIRSRIARVMRDGSDLFETQHRARDGRILDVEVSMGYSGVAGGRFFVFIRDITLRKRAEAQILAAKTEAERANRAKSEFLAAMSHDLRTPLNAIMGFADIMRSRTFGPVGNTRYQEYLDNIYNSGALLVSLVNDVLDLSKVESGKYELRDEVVDMRRVLEQARQHTAIMATAGQQDVILAVPPDLPLLRGDERALMQILNNIVSNALKYNRPQGTVTLTAEENRDGGLTVRVRDSGIGMDAEGIRRALAPFERVDSLHSHQDQGTGLGLYLCRRLMGVFGGTLTIDSTPGEGTEVILRFPPERTLQPTAA